MRFISWKDLGEISTFHHITTINYGILNADNTFVHRLIYKEVSNRSGDLFFLMNKINQNLKGDEIVHELRSLLPEVNIIKCSLVTH